MLKTIKKQIKPVVMHVPALRKTYRTISWHRRKKQYSNIAKSTKTNTKMVVFESFMGRSFSCSPKAIFEAMCTDERFSDFEFVWVFRGGAYESHLDSPELKHAKIVKRGSTEYKHALAQAKYWVFNSRSPEYLTPKDDQVYIQCWHGTPLKRLGCDIEIETTNALNTSSELAQRYIIESRKWTYFISPSPYATEHLGDAFGIPKTKRPDIVIEKGYPRNDWLHEVCINSSEYHRKASEIKYKLGIPSKKKVMLYAPTWRDDEYEDGVGYVQNPYLDFDSLKKELEDEWVVLFRAHYFIANQINLENYSGFAFNVSDRDDINELYAISDILVTDYSSVFFDYAVTKRPMAFFMPDLDHYESSIRGFYFDLTELPGPICKTQEELVDALKTPNLQERYQNAYDSFQRKFCPYEDGHAAERVIEKVFASRMDQR